MEQIEKIDGIEYVALYDENGELIYRYMKSDESSEPQHPDPVDQMTLPTTKGDIKVLNEMIMENLINTEYLTCLTELGL